MIRDEQKYIDWFNDNHSIEKINDIMRVLKSYHLDYREVLTTIYLYIYYDFMNNKKVQNNITEHFNVCIINFYYCLKQEGLADNKYSISNYILERTLFNFKIQCYYTITEWKGNDILNFKIDKEKYLKELRIKKLESLYND